MEDKIGVFICTGYGIAEALDVDALCEVVDDEFSVALCKTVDSCEGAALEGIKQDIESEGLTKVVIGGISPRRYADDADTSVLGGQHRGRPGRLSSPSMG